VTIPARQACDGLTVLDLGQGMAGSMPGLLLADNGADVIKVEPPSGDWSRGEPGFLMWNRNKRGIVLDLTSDKDRGRMQALVGQADVLIESFRPGGADRLGVGWADVRPLNPRLVYCSISGFGPAASIPVDLPGYEGLVAAALGRMVGLDHLNGGVVGQDRAAPIFTSTPVASYGAGQLAVQGILAALLARDRTGVGDRVRTSLVQGAAAFLMRQEMPRNDTAGAPLVSPVTHAGIELCFMTAHCRDGRFLQMCARQEAHFRNWLTALDLVHLLEDPRFARAPLGLARLEDVAALEAVIRERMASRSRDEWMELFTTAYDVGCDPFLTPAEFLDHPQMVANGRVVEVDDPTVGRCRQLGPLVKLSETPSSVERAAPVLGEHTDEVLARLEREPAPPVTTALAPPTARPLEGITVVEAAYFIAGPMASGLLAELGARVIKVEPIDGDPYRRTGLQAAKFLHGKESIALDLKRPEAVAILHELVAGADVFIHSFRPGVPERLQVDYPTLAALNPRLVYLYAASYGSAGPQAGRSAFHSTPNALSGAGIMQAGRGNPPVDDSFPDPASAIGAATAILLGLAARARTGRGQALETTMLASTGYVMSPWLVFYDGSPPPATADRGQHGFHALYRLYRCAAGWLFLACVRESEWQALTLALGHDEWARDPRFATAAERMRHDEALIALVGAELATRPAAEWGARLGEQQVPAVQANESLQEHWFEREGLLVEAHHPVFGDYWRPGPKLTLDSGPIAVGPAAAVGEHSRALLTDLGRSASEIDRLIAAGVVGSWTPDANSAGAF